MRVISLYMYVKQAMERSEEKKKIRIKLLDTDPDSNPASYYYLSPYDDRTEL